MPHGPHHFVALTDMALTIVLRAVAEPEFQFRGGQDLLLYYVFSIISINYKYIFYIKTKITNLYSS